VVLSVAWDVRSEVGREAARCDVGVDVWRHGGMERGGAGSASVLLPYGLTVA